MLCEPLVSYEEAGFCRCLSAQMMKPLIHSTKATCLLTVFLVIAAMASRSFLLTVVATGDGQTELTEDEVREAEQISLTFTTRLSQSQDMGSVMDELFLPDSVERYVRSEIRRARADQLSYIVFSSGIFIDVSLLDKPSQMDWRRFYTATNNFMLLGLVYLSRRHGDVENLKTSDLYPRDAIKLLDANPMLTNLIQKKGAIRNFKSVEEIHSATATLEQAVAMMRKSLPARTSEKELADTLSEIKKSGFIKPQLVDAESFSFPKETRVIMVPALPFHALMLVRVDGKLRIAWAYFNPGD